VSDKHVDQVTGTETTGHVWDGDIRELNKPLPRWWLWTFYATIVWGIGFMVAYPAIPTPFGYTKGVLGFSQRTAVSREIDAAKAAQGQFREQLAKAPLETIRADPDLLRFAVAGGKAAFGENCAPCHGRSAQGAPGYPNLLDDDWLWGGTLADVVQTIEYGVRSDHKQTRTSAMPKFGVDQLLKPQEIDAAADYVLSLSGHATDPGAAAGGAKVFADQCATCHGEKGKGRADIGAPDLTDQIWLYGASKAAVVESIRTGRGGVMPAWINRLDPVTIKMLAVYVHSLGGGK
jgi:cytochrome c oxidase cbb3-type subunit 3